MILKKGTQVKIISGKDKGKSGEIIELNRKDKLVKIKAINISGAASDDGWKLKSIALLIGVYKNHVIDKINDIINFKFVSSV